MNQNNNLLDKWANNIELPNNAVTQNVENTKLKIWEVFLKFWKINEAQLNKLLEIQAKNREKWINMDIWDMIIRAWFIKRSELLFYLRYTKSKLKIWEELYINKLINNEQLDDAIKTHFLEKSKWSKVTFWDILIQKWYITMDEFIKFLNQKRYRLNKNETEYLDWKKDSNNKLNGKNPIEYFPGNILKEEKEQNIQYITFAELVVKKWLVTKFVIDNLTKWNDISDMELWKLLMDKKMITLSEFTDLLHEVTWEIVITSNDWLWELDEIDWLWKMNEFKLDYIVYRNQK